LSTSLIVSAAIGAKTQLLTAPLGGTAPYMAPEILITGNSGWAGHRAGYDKEIDMPLGAKGAYLH